MIRLRSQTKRDCDMAGLALALLTLLPLCFGGKVSSNLLALRTFIPIIQFISLLKSLPDINNNIKIIFDIKKKDKLIAKFFL